jgi:2',3'-cyclic-nucleotide 2'-phosphodiesterase (5'-nucleotidase family)
VICEVAVTGRVLLQALENGASLLPDYANAGRFPQVSGLTMTVNLSLPPGRRIQNVRVGGAPLDPDRTYTLALPDFVLEGGDGYTMFGASRVLVDKENGTPIRDALEDAITGKDIGPQIDGRIVVEP